MTRLTVNGEIPYILEFMKPLAKALLVFLLVWTLVPGMGEAIESAVHLVVEGHTAHSIPAGDSHAPSGPEHGCTGAVHLCSCHVSLAFAPGQAFDVMQDETCSLLQISSGSNHSKASAKGTYHPPRS